MLRRLTGHRHEEGSESLAFGKKLVPMNDMLGSGIEGGLELDFTIKYGLATNEDEGKRTGRFEAFAFRTIPGVVAIALGSADQIIGRKPLDTEMNGLVVQRRNLSPGAGSELALVEARKHDFRLGADELEGLLVVFAKSQAIRARENPGNGDGVGVFFSKPSAQGNRLTTVVEAGLEILGRWHDANE